LRKVQVQEVQEVQDKFKRKTKTKYKIKTTPGFYFWILRGNRKFPEKGFEGSNRKFLEKGFDTGYEREVRV
jgi:hypothetical protein